MGLRRHELAAVLLLWTAACGRTPSENADPRRTGTAEEVQPTEMTPAPSEPASPLPPFYVGRWAANAGLCHDGAWTVTEQEIHTAGEVSCRFDPPPQGPGPVEVDAVCHAEGPPRTYRLRLSYAESARALLIEHGPFADIGLIRCPSPDTR